ncbi:DNAj [Anaeramoeba flamelloides]|uniref:DNAj n=1 Tax=Anaeramoeba flamelloides TaxID=1746091 RepID=A0AAV7Y9B9_9EUKA|nr:DNAj [Anaeramoeba flamelloides]
MQENELLIEEDEKDVNWYEILHVQQNATDREIRSSFRKMAAKFHPDKNKSKEAPKIFKKATRAKNLLLNSNTRAIINHSLRIKHEKKKREEQKSAKRSKLKKKLERQTQEAKMKRKQNNKERMQWLQQQSEKKFEETSEKILKRNSSKITHDKKTIIARWKKKNLFNEENLRNEFSIYGEIKSVLLGETQALIIFINNEPVEKLATKKKIIAQNNKKIRIRKLPVSENKVNIPKQKRNHKKSRNNPNMINKDNQWKYMNHFAFEKLVLGKVRKLIEEQEKIKHTVDN